MKIQTDENKDLNLAGVEKNVIRLALTKCNGNLTRAAGVFETPAPIR